MYLGKTLHSRTRQPLIGCIHRRQILSRARALSLSLALLLCWPADATAAPETTRPGAAQIRTKIETWSGKLRDTSRKVRAADDRLTAAGHELKKLDLTDQRQAAAAFGDLSLTPQARAEAMHGALGASLSESAYTMMKSLAIASGPNLYGQAGQRLEHTLRPAGQLNPKLATTPWAIYVPQDLAKGGQAIDRFLASHDQPEFKAALHRSMNVLRVAATLEQETLSRIAVHVPQENQARVSSIISHYLSRIITLLAFPPESERHLRSIIDSSFRLGAWSIQDPAHQQASSPMMIKQLARIAGHSKALARKVERRAKVGLTSKERARRDRQLLRLSITMQRRLETLVQTTPEGKAALKALVRDLQLTSRVVIGSLGIVGAMRNEQMPAEQRAAMIKNSVEGMGPIFVKLLQTAMNQQGLRDALVGKNPSPQNPVLLALESLKDSVTPMSLSVVRRQVREALGQNIERLFSSFDKAPLAAGSIGQIHRATVREQGKDRQVVVKVQRRGLAQSFDDTLHVTNLAVKLVHETLTVFEEAVPPNARQTVEKVLSTIEATVPDLVRSFAKELDFSVEAQQMKHFTQLSRGDRQVVVPRVYDSHSTRTVLTMEYVQGEKLSTLIDRHMLAAQARKLQLPQTQLPAREPEAEARRRILVLAQQTLGLEPTGIMSKRLPEGFSFTLSFAHPLHQQARFWIDDSGLTMGPAPDQSLRPESINSLRERMVRSFAAQNTFYRTIHGDIHEGNFMVGADGQTLIYLDFGNMVQPDATNYRAAGNLVSGWALGRPARLARGIVQMSDRFKSLSRAEQLAVEQKATRYLVQTYGAKLERTKDDSPIGVALATASSCGLPLSSTMLQWMKTTVSMAGNLEHFNRAEVRPFNFRSYRRIAGSLLQEWKEARKAKHRDQR